MLMQKEDSTIDTSHVRNAASDNYLLDIIKPRIDDQDRCKACPAAASAQEP